jgi:hypothetical protein
MGSLRLLVVLFFGLLLAACTSSLDVSRGSEDGGETRVEDGAPSPTNADADAVDGDVGSEDAGGGGDADPQDAGQDVAQPSPIIVSFTADKGTLTAGSSTTLTAVFLDGTAVVDHGIGAVTSGVAVPIGDLTETTTFTLSVSAASGATVTQSLTITVVSAPSIAGFDAAKTTLTAGRSTELTAIFSGGAGSIDHGIGAVISGQPTPTDELTSDTTFTLTVTNAAGDSVSAAVAIATVAPPMIGAFTAARTIVTAWGMTELTATFSDGTGSIDHDVGAVSSGQPAPTGHLSTSTTFTLTVTNAASDSVSAQLTISTVPPPMITSFAASSTSIDDGDSVTLTGAFSGGDGVIDPGIGSVTSGASVSSGMLTASMTYTLTVTNTANDSVTAQVQVTASPRLYVSMTSPQAIKVFDTAARGHDLPLRTIDVGFAPQAIAAADGNLYAVDGSTGTIYVVPVVASGLTTPVRTIAGAQTLLDHPKGITARGGELFVSNAATNQILVFDASASGEVAPKRTLGGPSTKLAGPAQIRTTSDVVIVANADVEDVAYGYTGYPLTASGDTAPTEQYPAGRLGPPAAVFATDTLVYGVDGDWSESYLWLTPRLNGTTRRIVEHQGSLYTSLWSDGTTMWGVFDGMGNPIEVGTLTSMGVFDPDEYLNVDDLHDAMTDLVVY